MKIDKKQFIPYAVALIVILAVLLIFLNPMLSGKIIAQPDIMQHAGMSKESQDYYKQTGEQAFWTTRLFSGMPTYLISMRYNDILVSKLDKVFTLFYILIWDIFSIICWIFIFNESDEIRHVGCHYCCFSIYIIKLFYYNFTSRTYL